MKIENTEVFGFNAALRGMRNPRDSWDRSDSHSNDDTVASIYGSECVEAYNIGPKDLKLMTKLVKAGPEHRKYLRQIMIWADFTLPRFLWVELDTYKIGTVKNSCSTMNKIMSRPIVQEDFEYPIDTNTIERLNGFREDSRKEPSKRLEYLLKVKNELGEGYLQKATMSFNYETALVIYFQRRSHRLPQWQVICRWIEDLPYMKELIEAKKDR